MTGFALEEAESADPSSALFLGGTSRETPGHCQTRGTAPRDGDAALRQWDHRSWGFSSQSFGRAYVQPPAPCSGQPEAIGWPLSLDHSIVLSVVPVSDETYQKGETSFLRIIRKDAMQAA